MATLFKPTSYQRGTFLAVGAAFFWKILSFINSVLVAAYFGVNECTDLYFYIIIVFGFGVSFVHKINTAVVIPEAISLQAQNKEKSEHFLNILLFLYILLAILIVGLGYFFPVHITQLFSLFSKTTLQSNEQLLFLGFIFFALQLITFYLTSILEMYHRFSSALLSPLNAIFPLIFLLMAKDTLGISSMLYGFICANLVQIALFLLTLKKELSWNFTPHKISVSKIFIHNLISNQTIELATLVSNLLPLYLLSGLSNGLVSALNYAKQLSDSPSEILTLKVANISRIQLADDFAKNNWKDINRHFLSAQQLLAVILIPLAVFTCFYAQDIVGLFFRRGHFNLQNQIESSQFLVPLLWIMVLMLFSSIQNNIVTAGRKIKQNLGYSLFNILFFVLVLPISVKLWGGFAYPYTWIICCLLSLYVNFLFFKKEFPKLSFLSSLVNALKLLVLNAISLGFVVLYDHLFQINIPFFRVFLGGIIFMICLLTLYKIFHSYPAKEDL